MTRSDSYPAGGTPPYPSRAAVRLLPREPRAFSAFVAALVKAVERALRARRRRTRRTPPRGGPRRPGRRK